MVAISKAICGSCPCTNGMFEGENCYKMLLATGSKDSEILRFYEKAGYNSGDKTAFVQWLNME